MKRKFGNLGSGDNRKNFNKIRKINFKGNNDFFIIGCGIDKSDI